MSELPIDEDMSNGIAETLQKVFNNPWPKGISRNGLLTPMSRDGRILTFTTIRGRQVEVEVRALALAEEINPLYIGGD